MFEHQLDLDICWSVFLLMCPIDVLKVEVGHLLSMFNLNGPLYVLVYNFFYKNIIY